MKVGDVRTNPGALTPRLDRPGHGVEIIRSDSSRVTTTGYQPDGEVAWRSVAELDDAGTFLLTGYDPEGRVLAPIEPRSADRRVNVYGVATEIADYGHGLTVEQSFDDDRHLRHVAMRGPWGAQEQTLAPDGGRSLAWTTALHRGRRSWDPSGRTAAEEVHYT